MYLQVSWCDLGIICAIHGRIFNLCAPCKCKKIYECKMAIYRKGNVRNREPVGNVVSCHERQENGKKGGSKGAAVSGCRELHGNGRNGERGGSSMSSGELLEQCINWRRGGVVVSGCEPPENGRNGGRGGATVSCCELPKIAEMEVRELPSVA